MRYCDDCQRTKEECDNDTKEECEGKLNRQYRRDRDYDREWCNDYQDNKL